MKTHNLPSSIWAVIYYLIKYFQLNTNLVDQNSLHSNGKCFNDSKGFYIQKIFTKCNIYLKLS